LNCVGAALRIASLGIGDILRTGLDHTLLRDPSPNIFVDEQVMTWEVSE